MTSHQDDLSDYILDHYGTCAAVCCLCNKPGNPWLGRGCPSWQPAPAAKSWADLIETVARRGSAEVVRSEHKAAPVTPTSGPQQGSGG